MSLLGLDDHHQLTVCNSGTNAGDRKESSVLRDLPHLDIADRDEADRQLLRQIHHYNWHRPHQGIGGIAPMAKLKQSRNNLLTLHS